MNKKVRIKRLFGRIASIRDYVVDEAIKKGVTLEVSYKEDVMTLPPERLKDYFQTDPTKLFKSQYDGRVYRLYDYTWKPDKEEAHG